MRPLIILLNFLVSFGCFSAEIPPKFSKQIDSIAGLYNDGFASVVKKSVAIKEVRSDKNACINLLSFYMEGFSGGNSAAQFIVFINCTRVNGDPTSTKEYEKNVVGIFPFYQRRNHYQINSATFEDGVVSITSPQGLVSFKQDNSLWWVKVDDG